MIYGLVPIGGKGTRLGLTFSKEMLPQKNYLEYKPISNHLIDCMIQSGANFIYFIHGFEFKNDVIEYYTDDTYIHIKQKHSGFANVIKEFIENVDFEDDDSIFFGMPDTIFEGNPFTKMLEIPGVVCGLFKTDDNSKVDRLIKNKKQFKVKSKKTKDLEENFWGIIKFDGKTLKDMMQKDVFTTYTEIGDILNQYKFSTVKAGLYIDLGTWPNYNRYLSHSYY